MLDPGQKYGTSPVRLDGALRPSLGNLAASAIAGILWTAVSPTVVPSAHADAFLERLQGWWVNRSAELLVGDRAVGGRVTDQRATEAASDLANTRLVRYPHAPLRERVWDLRHNLTAYDATYLALAEALDHSVLLTGDRGLASRARTSLGDDRVHRVE